MKQLIDHLDQCLTGQIKNQLQHPPVFFYVHLASSLCLFANTGIHMQTLYICSAILFCLYREFFVTES